MKRSLKLTFFALTGVVALGVFLWMRSLASWRPQKIGVLPAYYEAQHIWGDGHIVTTMDMHSTSPFTFTTFDLTTDKSYGWPIIKSTDYQSNPVFGWVEPFYWSLHSSTVNDALTLEFQDPQTRIVKHAFHWRSREDANFIVVRIADGIVRVLSRENFREFDLSSGKMLRAVTLSNPFVVMPSAEAEGSFYHLAAISPDGKTLYGSWGEEGKVWEARTGKLLKSWTVPSSISAFYYSPNARILVCALPSNSSPTKYVFLDSATGKTRWTGPFGDLSERLSSEDGSELIVPKKNFCEVHDTLTGLLVRQLPGPRQSDGEILRVTSDSIYTANSQNEIFRWRAR